MIGIDHTLVILFASLGLVIGGVLIDAKRRFEDNALVMLSFALFCIFLGIGIIVHYWMDFIPLP